MRWGKKWEDTSAQCHKGIVLCLLPMFDWIGFDACRVGFEIVVSTKNVTNCQKRKKLHIESLSTSFLQRAVWLSMQHCFWAFLWSYCWDFLSYPSSCSFVVVFGSFAMCPHPFVHVHEAHPQNSVCAVICQFAISTRGDQFSMHIRWVRREIWATPSSTVINTLCSTAIQNDFLSRQCSHPTWAFVPPEQPKTILLSEVTRSEEGIVNGETGRKRCHNSKKVQAPYDSQC